MTKRQPPASWKPGQSGNPKGRPKGETSAAKLRESIAKDVPAIVAKLVELAKAGDAGAAKLLLDRALPPLKPVEVPVGIELPADGSLSDQGRALVVAAGGGVLAPMQAAQLLAGLAALARLVETDELAARIAALEAKESK